MRKSSIRNWFTWTFIVSSVAGCCLPPLRAAGTEDLPTLVKNRLQWISDELKTIDSYIAADSPAESWYYKLLPYYSSFNDEFYFDQIKTGLERSLDKAKDQLERLEDDRDCPKDHPEVKALKEKVAAAETAIKAYLEKKRVDDPQTHDRVFDIGKGVEGYALYHEAKAAFEEYQKATFPYGKFNELEQLEDGLKQKLDRFPENVKGSAMADLSTLERYLTILEERWKEQGAEALPIDEFAVNGYETQVVYLSTVLPADNERVTNAKKRWEDIKKQNQSVRAKLLDKRTMKPDVYKGKDAEALKDLAKSIVLKKHPKAEVLRVTLTREKWEREAAMEWTDTTKTALQFRVTDGMYAQAAAKEEGEVTLYTLFLNKDRIGGVQGGLKGHIMYTDKMLEKNVNK